MKIKKLRQFRNLSNYWYINIVRKFRNYKSLKNIDITTFVGDFNGYPLKEEKAKVQDEWQVSTPFL
jgi:hypothetical protein